MVGFDSQSKMVIDKKFICPVCSLILRDPVQFNTCGHRLCQSCFLTLNQDVVKCAECYEETSANHIMRDHGFQSDMQSLPIICSYCNWTDTLKSYQEHLTRSHSNSQCHYCHQQFNSIQHLNEHQVFQCDKKTIDCMLKDFGCQQQILRRELSDHYLSKQHQDAIVHALDQMKINASQTTTTTDNELTLNQLEELYETTDILRDGAQSFGEDIQRLNSELNEHESKLQSLMQKGSQIQSSIEEENALLDANIRNIQILNQELVSLKERIDDLQYISHDGTFTWKITNFHEKMRDAQSERQTSVYSPPFYSSLAGYKMRARLYLNGDGNARQTHMSLFLVLMRGRNDSILKFPFAYKVTFCLYDQSPAQRHIIDSFRPDIRSSSFQQPRSEMNIASGIPKFFPLAMIQQQDNPYVRDDTLFIKVMIDFGDMPKTLLPYALSLNPGLPTNIQHNMIREEAERRAQMQTSSQQ